jgi:hypothetical protein
MKFENLIYLIFFYKKFCFYLAYSVVRVNVPPGDMWGGVIHTHNSVIEALFNDHYQLFLTVTVDLSVFVRYRYRY